MLYNNNYKNPSRLKNFLADLVVHLAVAGFTLFITAAVLLIVGVIILSVVAIKALLSGSILYLVYPYLIKIFPIQGFSQTLTWSTAFQAAFLVHLLAGIQITFKKDKVKDLKESVNKFFKRNILK